ncbi:MAG TPA: XRE family transcriptional regulator, partial [Candidatus Coproplasma stercoravium]|nr:XRE family transcriptional regulator [Candidatus Coproplasma stercoravium]
MSYILKHFDTNLLYFDMQKDIDGVSTHILSVNNEHKSLLPLDLELSDHGLAIWLKRRTIPSNRAYVQNFLAKLGLNEKDTKGIIDFCKGLSLNDCYWVIEDNFKGKFAENNLYDNRFSNVLSQIAFTG